MGKCLTNYRAVRIIMNEGLNKQKIETLHLQIKNIKCSAVYKFFAAEAMFGLVELS